MSGAGANQSYPQDVNLDTAKAKAAQMQQTQQAQTGDIKPTDPASKAKVPCCRIFCHDHNSHACRRRRVHAYIVAFTVVQDDGPSFAWSKPVPVDSSSVVGIPLVVADLSLVP